MKTPFVSACVALLITLPSTTHAQDDYAQPEETAPVAVYEMPSVVYEAPVVYYAPVVYQMPVSYYAPVYYVSSPPVEDYAPPETPLTCGAPSTVFVIGVHGGSYGYSTYGNSCSTVIPFGQRGGWFGGQW